MWCVRSCNGCEGEMVTQYTHTVTLSTAVRLSATSARAVLSTHGHSFATVVVATCFEPRWIHSIPVRVLSFDLLLRRSTALRAR